MQGVQVKIISIADACLGGLRERAALLVGPEEICQPYTSLLLEAGVKTIFQEKDYSKVSSLLPQVQLLMNMPVPGSPLPLLTAGTIAGGCIGRRTPLLIFDLAASTSIEELAGLLPSVCLYTPSDLRQVLYPTTDAQIA